MEKKDYSDVEVLYGQSSVNFKEMYKFMMAKEEEWSKLGYEIWEKDYPEMSGVDKDYIQNNPVTEEERDRLEDLEAQLWQMCHQLIHTALMVIGDGTDVDDETYSHILPHLFNGLPIKFFTSATEGMVWFVYNNEVIDDDDPEKMSIQILFELAQQIYHEACRINNDI